MKMVTREAFLALPPNTVYTHYWRRENGDEHFGHTAIKLETLYQTVDGEKVAAGWNMQVIDPADTILCDVYAPPFLLEEALASGEDQPLSMTMEYHVFRPRKKEMFGIFSQVELSSLIEQLQKCQVDNPPVPLNESSPDDIRALGWSVAVHNDYRQFTLDHTFWLFTKGDQCVKGEGRTDKDALNQVRERIKNLTA